MKITFLKKGYSPVGGSEVLTYELATRLAARGHAVRVLCQWPAGERYGFPPRQSLRRETREYRLFWHRGVEIYQLLPRLGGLGRRLDVLSPFNLLRGGLALALAGCPEVIHNVCREYAPQALALSRALGARLVLTPLAHPGQFWAGDRATDVALYRQADAVVALTGAEKRWYAARGVTGDRVHVVGLGPCLAAPGDGAAFRHQYNLAGPVVLFIGRKEPYKGVGALVRAAALVWQRQPATHFVFIGEGSFFDLFADPFRGRQDPRFLNLPRVDEASKANAYAACDVFCLPSRHETFGMVYAEAWLCGKPVVGGDIPTLRDVIADGSDGFCVPQRPEAIAGALLRLLDDPALRARLGEAGRRKVADRFNWDEVVRQHEALYERLLCR
ncbi:MAG: glycosyltransferase family 4 protein [Chloroflexi bacterium]|nr:glycosyltransferase family 4 protein [Chloroflexota bacterium]